MGGNIGYIADKPMVRVESQCLRSLSSSVGRLCGNGLYEAICLTLYGFCSGTLRPNVEQGKHPISTLVDYNANQKRCHDAKSKRDHHESNETPDAFSDLASKYDDQALNQISASVENKPPLFQPRKTFCDFHLPQVPPNPAKMRWRTFNKV